MTASSSGGEATSTHHATSSLVLGVDGGGTKTLARVAQVDAAGRITVVGEGIAGSSNQVAVGIDVALQNLWQSIEAACASSSIATGAVAASIFALAGSGTERAQQHVLDFATQQLHLTNTQVVHDGEAVLAAGTPAGYGIALIVGTGAVAYGKDQAGGCGIVGGWGYWFGDEGSAYWLGQAALRAISQAADGRAAETTLSQRVLQHLQLDSPREILTALNKQGDVRLSIANLASLVCDVANEQDKVATKLLQTAARHWVEHLECLVKGLEFAEPVPIAIAGGVLCGSEFAQDQLQLRLRESSLSNCSIQYVPEPVMGCLTLASRRIPSPS